MTWVDVKAMTNEDIQNESRVFLSILNISIENSFVSSDYFKISRHIVCQYRKHATTETDYLVKIWGLIKEKKKQKPPQQINQLSAGN